MLLLLIVMVSSCAAAPQRCNATYTADMICRRNAGVLRLVNQRDSREPYSRRQDDLPCGVRQNIPHGLTQVIRFRNGLAGVAVHPDIKRQNGPPVVPPLSPWCLCLSATTRLTSSLRHRHRSATVSHIAIQDHAVVNTGRIGLDHKLPCFAGTSCDDSISTALTPRIIQRPVAGSYSNQPPSSYSVTSALSESDGGGHALE